MSFEMKYMFPNAILRNLMCQVEEKESLTSVTHNYASLQGVHVLLVEYKMSKF